MTVPTYRLIYALSVPQRLLVSLLGSPDKPAKWSEAGEEVGESQGWDLDSESN